MTKYARLDSANTVIEIFEHDTLAPFDCHVTTIAEQFVGCPQNVQPGWVKSGSIYTAPTVTPAVETPPKVTPPQFKLLILPELPAILALIPTDPVIAAFISIIDDSRLSEVDLSLQSTQQGLQYCLKAIGQTEAEIAERIGVILTGQWT